MRSLVIQMFIVAFICSIANAKPKKPTEYPELKKMFEGSCSVYRKQVPTLIRLPKPDEIGKDFVTYTAKDCEGRQVPPGPNTYQVETKNKVRADHVIARNKDVIGKKPDGTEIYNEWLIPKNEFFNKYRASQSDLKAEFKPFIKQSTIRAIKVTDEVIKILGGSGGKASIEVGWSTECMSVEKGGLLTEDYSIRGHYRSIFNIFLNK